jgi:transposase
VPVAGIMASMLGMRDLQPQDLQGLAPEALAAVAAQLIEHVEQQRQQLASKDRVLAEQSEELQRKDREITLRDAKLEKIHFELARLKRWKFGARTEAMNTEQRAMFQETLLEDEASLQAQLAALQAQADAAKPDVPSTPKAPPRKPRRQALPEHLRRVEHHHEPEDTACPTTGCGQPMVRVGEDVSEKLDIVPAEFFVHRHIYGKWACRCCERLVQEPADPQIIDGGIPAGGLVAHTLISRFADHLPYYRLEAINARAGVHTPRSTLAAWAGQAGAALEPLYEAHKRFVLGSAVLHADETPLALLDPGAGKTKKAYIWGYARGEFDAQQGVIYEFTPGRGGQYPLAFLGGPGQAGHRRQTDPLWRGTLLCDEYAGYGPVLDQRLFPERRGAGCLAHARRKYEEIARAGSSTVAKEAIERLAAIYHVEGQLRGMDAVTRQQARQQLNAPQFKALHAWLQVQRRQVPDGGAIAGAIAYSLNHWAALTAHLDDGAVPMDNNFMERQLKPWQMGRKAWLFIGSELAGQRAAVVMSLVQSAKLNGHDPWAYLRDVLARLPMHLNSRIDELLPHRWQPSSSGHDA